jgi:hypothetical protein
MARFTFTVDTGIDWGFTEKDYVSLKIPSQAENDEKVRARDLRMAAFSHKKSPST